MKKIVGTLLVLLGVLVIAGCGNSKGKEAYEEFKERYAIDYSDSEKLDEYYLSIYDVKGTFYVKFIDEHSSRYHKWDKGSEVKEGKEALIYQSEGDWTRLVGNAEPVYEQNIE